MFVDPTGMVLRIVDGDKKLFYTLQKLSDDILQMDDNGRVTIQYSAGEDSAHKNGTELVRRIIYNAETINVTQKDSGTSGFDSVMAKVSINFKNTNTTLPTYNGDGSGRSHGEGIQDFIILGHELIHAEHFLRGTYDTTATTTNYYRNHNGILKTEHNEQYEEIRTVGPIAWEEGHGRRYRDKYTGDITENDLRWEHGIRMRSGYNWYN